MSRKEILNEEYLELKQTILDGDTYQTISVSNKEVDFQDMKNIIVSGTSISITPDATKGLIKLLGISGAFIKTINNTFGENSDTLLKEILKQVKAKNTLGLTLVYNNSLNMVTAIYPTGSKIISDNQYFKSLEGLIDGTPGSYLRNISAGIDGSISAIIANPKLEFQFGGLAEEVFTSGMSLDLDITTMSSSFFTERLFCTNGQKTTSKLCTRKAAIASQVPGFLTSILDADFHVNSIGHFKEQINTCYHTRASIKEMLWTEARLSSLMKADNFSMLGGNLSSIAVKEELGEVLLMRENDHKYMRSPITLWDLVNEVTAISSRIEREKLKVDENINLEIQVLGGSLMFNRPDLIPGNIKQIY